MTAAHAPRKFDALIPIELTFFFFITGIMFVFFIFFLFFIFLLGRRGGGGSGGGMLEGRIVYSTLLDCLQSS